MRYRQPAGEYVRPSGTYRIADPRRLPQLFDSQYVRGARYRARGFKGLRSGQIVDMELVPEPGNPSDKGAVALHVRGTHIGYIAGAHASLCQDVIVPLNRSGKAVLATGLIVDGEGCVATVYLPWLHLTVPYGPDYASECKALLADLSAQEMESALSRHPEDHSSAVVAQIRGHSRLAPSLNWGTEKSRQGLPAQLVWHLAPTYLRLKAERKVADKALRAHQQAESFRLQTEERMTFPAIAGVLGCSANVASKLYQEHREGLTAGEKRSYAVGDSLREAEYKEKVLALHKSGASVSSVANELKSATASITKILRDSGEVPANHNETSREDRIERCRAACRMQEQGLARKEIAAGLKVSIDTVKSLLKDGKFYAEPASDIDRLVQARRSRIAEISALDLTASAKFLGMTVGGLKEARKDHSALGRIHGAAMVAAR